MQHRFAPDFFVPPGGRVDASDYAAQYHSRLPASVVKHMEAGSCPSPLAVACAVAAVRETYEETGLAVGPVSTVTGTVLPHLKPLRYLGRAITNTQRPIRYHARFFAVDASDAAVMPSSLEGNGELLDLCWVTPAEAIASLPLVDVTEFFLRELSLSVGGQAPRGPVRVGSRALSPFFRYRKGNAIITYE